jgi:hypothetical protein
MNGEILRLFPMRNWAWPNAAPESRRVPFSTRTLFQILNAKDQQELRHRITLWSAAFQTVALGLLTGLQSTGFLTR